MDQNGIEIGDKGIADRMQDAVGGFAADTRARLDGAARQMAGTAQDTYSHAREQMRDAATAVSHSVQHQPLVALLVAGVLGCMLGILLARR